MKKKVIGSVIGVFAIVGAFNLSLEVGDSSPSLKVLLYNLNSLEALAKKESDCVVNSDSKKNTGACENHVNTAQGAVCVTSSWTKNCYSTYYY